MKESVSRRWRTAAVLATGLAIGTAFAATPVSSHVAGPVEHLWRDHIRPKTDFRYYTKEQANARYVGVAEKAADAEQLDGLDSAAFARGDNVQAASLSLGPIVDQTGTTLLQVDVTTPDKCNGVDSHRYLVQASGFDFDGVGTSFVRHELTLDSTTIAGGPTFRGANLNGGAFERASYAMEQVYTVDAGPHSFRLLADAVFGDYQASTATMVVMDLGYSCG